MFTRIEPLIQAVIRKTEKTDSHMGLGRDESVVDDRKKGESRTSPEEWEDMTEVSVLALRGFLQELIGLTPVLSSPSSAPIPDPDEKAAVIPGAPQNPMASRAARAYQTTGRIVHDRNVAPEPPPAVLQTAPPPQSENGAAVTGNFSAEEVEMIQTYIAALLELEQKGVESVYLSRSSTFLESIRDAIAAAQ